MTINWHIYRQTDTPHGGIADLPSPPDWRKYEDREMSPRSRGLEGWKHADLVRGRTYRPEETLLNPVNAALYLRRPLLVTGTPGVGKSGLAYSVAWQLGLGSVLRWPITSGSTRKEGLYSYDPVSRLHDVNLDRLKGVDGSDSESRIGRYLRLGPLGTALLPSDTPRVLLIDEIDKAPLDLPNDLLSTFEEGEYDIPELVRMAAVQEEVDVPTADGTDTARVLGGHVHCRQFPFVVMTSNGERDFPAAFLRRCVRIKIDAPGHDQLEEIVRAHLGRDMVERAEKLIEDFERRAGENDLANDQLLNAIHLLKVVRPTRELSQDEQDDLVKLLLTPLSESALP